MFDVFYKSKGTSSLPFEFDLERETLDATYVLSVLDGCVLGISSGGAFYFNTLGKYSSLYNLSYYTYRGVESYSGMEDNFLRRSSKGITYKVSVLPSGVEITKNKNRNTITLKDVYAYNVYKYKKHYERALVVYNRDSATSNFKAALEIIETQRKNGSVRYSKILLYSANSKIKQECFYEVQMKELSKGKVQLYISKNCRTGQTFEFKMPDASIENLFKPEHMFEFDLLASDEYFQIVNTIRNESIRILNEKVLNGGCNVLRTVLNNINKD